MCLKLQLWMLSLCRSDRWLTRSTHPHPPDAPGIRVQYTELDPRRVADHFALGWHTPGQRKHQPPDRVDVRIPFVLGQHGTDPGLKLLHREPRVDVERTVGAFH